MLEMARVRALYIVGFTVMYIQRVQGFEPYVVTNNDPDETATAGAVSSGSSLFTEGGDFIPKYSKDQLSAKLDLNQFLILFSNVDPTEDTNKFLCDNITVTFSEPTEKDPMRIVIAAHPVDDKVLPETCTIHWGDDKTTSFKIGKTGTTKHHDYEEFGAYVVNVECTYEDDNGTLDVRCPLNSGVCGHSGRFFSKQFKDVNSPMTFWATDAVQISAQVKIQRQCHRYSTNITWKIARITETGILPFDDFNQPNSVDLFIPPGILEHGVFLVKLEITFPELDSNDRMFDYVMIKVVLPELVTFILGGTGRTAHHGDVEYVNASLSRDPLENSNFTRDLPLNASWSIMVYPPGTPINDLKNEPLSRFPVYEYTLLDDGVSYEITPGIDYILKLDTGLFPAGSTALVMFSLERGTRQSSSIYSVAMVNNGLPIRIDCVFNCVISRERRFTDDKIELDAFIPTEVLQDFSALTFSWSVWIWFPSNDSVSLVQPSTTTGFGSRSLGIPESALSVGFTYEFKVYVGAPGYAVSQAFYMGNIAPSPYGGTCTLGGYGSDPVVTAATEMTELECTYWKGPDTRVTSDPALDNNPILAYTVIQITTGAVVPAEPILYSRSNQAAVILKIGYPEGGYNTSVVVRITDMYNAYTEVSFNATALPAFAWDAVNDTAEGAAIVQNFYTEEYNETAQSLRSVGKYDMAITLISCVTSHFHLIDLPVFEMPVPPVLNEGGAILDLKSGGEVDDVGTLSESLADADDREIDQTTKTIQTLMQDLLATLNASVHAMYEAERSDDKTLMAILTCVDTNLVYKYNFISMESQTVMIWFANVLGKESMVKIDNLVEQSRQLEEASGHIYVMSQSTVNTVVSNELRHYRKVGNLDSGRYQVSDMLKVKGQNVSTDNANFMPEERAFLYLQMQRKIRKELRTFTHNAVETVSMVKSLMKAVRDGLQICNTCSNSGSETTKQLVKKGVTDSIQHEWMGTERATFTLNGSLNAVLGNDSGGLVTAISAVELKENVFMYDEDKTSSLVSSNILRIDIKTGQEEVTPNETTFTQEVTSPEIVLTEPLVDPDDASELSLHVFIYQSNTDYVCLKVRPYSTKITKYKIYFSFEKAPTAIEYDFIETVSWRTDWQLYVEPAKMAGHTGLTYIGIFVPGEVKLVKYEFMLVTFACVAWEDEIRKWHTDKCLPEWLPKENKLLCRCQNLTELTFGNTFSSAPNTIDFSTVFLKFSPRDQAAIIGVMGGLFVIFIVAVIFTGKLDRNDMIKWGITPLRDNRITDKKYYIIRVSTGIRRGAGTRSHVAFSLTGSVASTVSRELFDGVRTEFSTGSDMTFLMSTEKDLGHIEHLYIWHDNSGGTDFGAWYLNQVVVYDPDNKRTYTFVAERWLSLDTTLQLSLPSNLTGITLPIDHRFCHETRLGLSERNMWVSILYRPQSSVFTRVQRTACVLVYILLAMLTSAMFYRDDDEYESTTLFQVGPLRFSVDQLYRSLMSAVISTPPVLLITFLFKRTRLKQNDISTERHNSSNCCLCCSKCCRDRYDHELGMRIVWSGPPELRGGLYLPHWCLIFVWLLVTMSILAPAFFVFLYCIQWGKQKSEEWITSVLLSIAESVLLVDPFMMIATALVLSCLFRKSQDTVTYDMDAILKNYKKVFCFEGSGAPEMLRTLRRDIASYQANPPNVCPPPQGLDLDKQTDRYKYNREMSTVLKELVVILFLVFTLMCVCYTTRDDASYLHHQHISNSIISPALKRTSPQLNYYSITKQGDVYRWLNTSVFPWLFPDKDVTGKPLHWREREFTSGNTYLRLGPPRLRQLRTKNESCTVPLIGTVECYRDYSVLREEDADYCIGWTGQPCSFEMKVVNLSLAAWSFVSALDIWGFPVVGHVATYGGGGYIASFNVNHNTSVALLNELFWTRWIDRQTRAVLLEFTLFSAETNLFIYNEFLIEFPETGGAVKSHQIYPLRLYRHLGTLGIFTMVCEAILAAYWLFLMVRIFVKMYNQGKEYFNQVWQVCDIAIVVLIASAILFYIFRLLLAIKTIKSFNEDKKKFVNFAHIVFWDTMLAIALGFLTFLVMFRILQIFNSAKKIQAILSIFQQCGRDLVWFGFAFWYFFLAFAFCGFLLFGSQLVEFNTAFAGIKTLFLALIGKSMFAAITEASPIFAQIFFIIFTMCITFFVFTLFLSILCGGIDNIMHDQRSEQHEDIIDRMMRKVSELVKGKQGPSKSPV